MSIEAVLSRHEDSLMRMPGVQAVAVGESAGRQVIKVYVDGTPASAGSPAPSLPATLEGYEVEIEEIGSVHALNQKP